MPVLQFIPKHHVTESHPSGGDNPQSMGGRSQRREGHAKWPRETHSVTHAPGLSTLTYLSRIDAQPPLSFLCCPKPPSHHPCNPTSVSLVHALHLLMPSTPFWPYNTHPFFSHAQTISILSELLYSLLPFYSSSPTHLFISNSTHSWHSNQSSQTLHLKNIHFPSLSTTHTPHCRVIYTNKLTMYKTENIFSYISIF